MATKPFVYQDPYPLGEDKTKYRKVEGSEKYVSIASFEGNEILKVDPEALTILANEAMRDISFLLRREHNESVGRILRDPEASQNDKGVAVAFLRNAEISAQFELPVCQDTGTATIIAKKGQQVWTGGKDEEALSKGVYKTYTEENLRYSQTVALDMYREVNSGTNLPAQIDIQAVDGDAYKFLFMAKGRRLGQQDLPLPGDKGAAGPGKPSAIPGRQDEAPRHGRLPAVSHRRGRRRYQCRRLPEGGQARLRQVLRRASHPRERVRPGVPRSGAGAETARRGVQAGDRRQFGGKYFAHDVRVVRLPRHGASCPLGMAVSCSADRNVKAKITRDGIFVEELDRNPGRLIPEEYRGKQAQGVRIDLNQPMKAILAELSKHPVSTPLLLNGTIIVGRDIAHAKFKELIDAGKPVPEYLLKHPIYYAGPAKTPKGKASGSFGPTTAGRMDSYVDLLQSKGASMIMIAKGNRSQQVTDACKKYGGFYLGSIGGPAAVLAEENIKKVECIDFPELGMEAVWQIEVENFPAFILVDDKGNDFFKQLGL